MIRPRKCQSNIPLQDNHPQGNLEFHDETVIPEHDLNVITRKTNFDKFPRYTSNKLNTPSTGNIRHSSEYIGQQDQNITFGPFE